MPGDERLAPEAIRGHGDLELESARPGGLASHIHDALRAFTCWGTRPLFCLKWRLPAHTRSQIAERRVTLTTCCTPWSVEESRASTLSAVVVMGGLGHLCSTSVARCLLLAS